MDEVTGTALLVAASLGLVLFAACYTAVHGLDQPRIAVAFGAIIAVGELVRITLPGDREAAPLGAAGALAYALLTTVQNTPTTHDAWQVVAVTSIATLVGAMPHVAAGRAPRLEQIARRVLTTAFAAAIFRPLFLHDAFRHDIGWIF